MKKYDDYVVFILGRSFLTDILPNYDDIAYEVCIKLAKDFEVSEFNVDTKGLYECVEEYVADLLERLQNVSEKYNTQDKEYILEYFFDKKGVDLK